MLFAVLTLDQIPSTWEKLKLPLKPLEKPSYSQNSVVWIRTTGLQADIQKILRHARKLPEKIHNFYKVRVSCLYILNAVIILFIVSGSA